jgi:hypothetical protein
MLPSLSKPLTQVLLFGLALTAFTASGNGSQWNPEQDPKQPPPDAPIYFPPGRNDAGIFPYVLYDLKEPSFFEAAKDPSVTSFRMSVIAYVTGWMLSVRLDVNADGSGQITSATSTWHAAAKRESKNVSPAEVKSFLQVVDKTGFWSMTKIEEISELGGRKVYTFDGDAWLVEGVRNGSFHYVQGPNPKPAPIMEIVHYLARDLAKLDDSKLPIPGYPIDSAGYAKLLGRMDESQLPSFTEDLNAEVYRLMILPTWGNPIAIRVQRHGELYALAARRLDGQAGYEYGTLVESKDVDLSADDSKALSDLIQGLGFFQLPMNDGVLEDDGDYWILEGVSQGNYHVALRWSAASYDPGKRGLKPFLALCRFLVDNSSLSERPKNKGHKII